MGRFLPRGRILTGDAITSISSSIGTRILLRMTWGDYLINFQSLILQQWILLSQKKITQLELHGTIDSMATWKTHGHNEIPIEFLQQLWLALGGDFCRMIRKGLKEGAFCEGVIKGLLTSLLSKGTVKTLITSIQLRCSLPFTKSLPKLYKRCCNQCWVTSLAWSKQQISLYSLSWMILFWHRKPCIGPKLLNNRPSYWNWIFLMHVIRSCGDFFHAMGKWASMSNLLGWVKPIS